MVDEEPAAETQSRGPGTTQTGETCAGKSQVFRIRIGIQRLSGSGSVFGIPVRTRILQPKTLYKNHLKRTSKMSNNHSEAHCTGNS